MGGFNHSIGFKKCGTHALQRTMGLFIGSPSVVHGHIFTKSEYDKAHKTCHIVRNPRAVLFSWLRFAGLDRSEINALNNMEDIIRGYKQYLPVINDPDVLTVRFEELLSDPTVVNTMGVFLGLEPCENHFNEIWGRTRTFTGDLTQWRNHWTDSVDCHWSEYGGIELERLLDYDPYKIYVRKTNGEITCNQRRQA